jgi:hypothetical protein
MGRPTSRLSVGEKDCFRRAYDWFYHLSPLEKFTFVYAVFTAIYSLTTIGLYFSTKQSMLKLQPCERGFSRATSIPLRLPQFTSGDIFQSNSNSRIVEELPPQNSLLPRN